MDAEALRAELERHHVACVGWALACCRFNPSEADDVLQTAYLRILDGRAVFRAQSSFRTWLFGVVRRTAMETRRRQAWRWLLERRNGQGEQGVAPDASLAAEAHEDEARLRAALVRLPARQREVLHLVFQQDLKVEEAAVVMNVSVGTARVHYARGKERLRLLLGKKGGR